MVEGGEGACGGRVWLAAVGGQHARNVAGTRVERRGRHRGGVEGAVQRLQERHGFVAGRDVLGRLGAGTLVSSCTFSRFSWGAVPSHRVFLRVRRLRSDDGVEAGRRDGTEFLPHGSDLQQRSKSCGGEI